MQITVEERKNGDAGTKQTVEKMWQVIQDGCTQWPVITKARDIIEGCDPRSPRRTGDEIFRWIKQNIRFVKDPTFTELLQTPARMLKERRGDCDCQVMLGAALNAAIGNRIRIVTIAHLPECPTLYSHTYYEVECRDGSWRSYDPAPNGTYPGWAPPKYYRKTAWYYNGDTQTLAGFFDKIFKEIERVARRIRDEAKRTWRRIKAEADRVQDKINAELARWEKDLGPAGKFLILGAKVGVTVLTAGSMAPILATTLMTATGAGIATGGIVGAGIATGTTAAPLFQQITAVGIQVEDNPFKLTEDEWILLAKIASSIGSAVLTFVSAGGTAALLAGTVLQLANTAVSGVELHDNLEKRKRALDKLKAMQAKYEIEKRIQREALKKLETDIAILERIVAEQAKYNERVKALQAKKEAELKAEEAKLRKQKKREIEAYREKILGELNLYINKRAAKLRWENFQAYKEAAKVVRSKFEGTREAIALSDWIDGEKAFLPYHSRYIYSHRQRYVPGEEFSGLLYSTPVYPGVNDPAYFPNYPADVHGLLAKNPQRLNTSVRPYIYRM
jgi:hypothetical protein